jgi:hypothetical protein
MSDTLDKQECIVGYLEDKICVLNNIISLLAEELACNYYRDNKCSSEKSNKKYWVNWAIQKSLNLEE